MDKKATKNRGQWASNLGFILAGAGSAIGLGNMWKFPGKVGVAGTVDGQALGGGFFLITYILVVFLIGFTVMNAELALGRNTKKNCVGTFKALNKKWSIVGYLSMLTPFVIMSYYSVVGGWVIKYIVTYLCGANFVGGYENYFISFITNPISPLFYFAIFLGLCVFILLKGVSSGIEKLSKILMPILFILLIAIAIRSITLDGALEGLKFMFTFNTKTINPKMLITAIGQAFFSLSLGMGIMITYGSYVKKTDNIIKSATSICFLDTLVAFIAGCAVIPAVFATNTNLGMGGGFAFIALPSVFVQMPAGNFFGLLFFLLLFFAALTSAVSLFEGNIAYVSEEFNISRRKSIFLLIIPMTLLGVGYSATQGAFTFNLPWFDVAHGFNMISMANFMEKLTDNLTIPLCALLISLFVGWSWGTDNALKEIEQKGTFKFKLYKCWAFSIKYIVPVCLVTILVYTIGFGIGLS